MSEFTKDNVIEYRCNMIDMSDIISLNNSDVINWKLCNGYSLLLREWDRCPSKEKRLLENLIELRKYKVIFD